MEVPTKTMDKRYRISPEAMTILKEKMNLKSNVEIAEKYDTSPQRVARILSSEEVQSALMYHHNKLFNMMDKATDVIESAIDKGDVDVSMQIVKGFGFLTPKKNVEVNFNHRKSGDKKELTQKIITLITSDTLKKEESNVPNS